MNSVFGEIWPQLMYLIIWNDKIGLSLGPKYEFRMCRVKSVKLRTYFKFSRATLDFDHFPPKVGDFLFSILPFTGIVSKSSFVIFVLFVLIVEVVEDIFLCCV